ncbi:MAG: hypothetical protein LBJ95_04740 [Oscillospiraceae bacterium]|jgi:hypothetical protein|nr:hypothetical protein [Oscillospiraceae bacterium]
MPPAKVIALNATSFSSALHLKLKQKSPAKFVKVFAKPLLSREQNFPHFPLLVKGEFIT